jgi:DNA-damage-inducible protein D
MKNKSRDAGQGSPSGLTLAAIVAYAPQRLSPGVYMPENEPLQHVFHFEEDQDNFERHAVDNGIVCWYASDLAEMLGYQSYATFSKAVNRAISACTALNIPVLENFQQVRRTVNGEVIDDYKLSRFACYLVAMNASPSKPKVAAAQAYFATLAESFRQSFQEADGVERVLIRDEISEREKTLASVAKYAGVHSYAFFQSAGYRGMYNMTLAQLRARRSLPQNQSPLDYMGKTELAGNLFRITQTEEKIKNEGIKGQVKLEQTAHHVGAKVRRTMIELSGTPPEYLPVAEDIKEVRKGLKTTQREFKKIDKEKKTPRRLKP